MCPRLPQPRPIVSSLLSAGALGNKTDMTAWDRCHNPSQELECRTPLSLEKDEEAFEWPVVLETQDRFSVALLLRVSRQHMNEAACGCEVQRLNDAKMVRKTQTVEKVRRDPIPSTLDTCRTSTALHQTSAWIRVRYLGM